MTTHYRAPRAQNLAKLEIAQETLGCLVAYRSEMIFDERKKAEPDAALIDRWKDERNALIELTRSFNCEDMEAINDAIEAYGPTARAVFELH